MLTLPIKKKWYDMILSGEKKEEYREEKPYYLQRFATLGVGDKSVHTILLRNGYSSNSPTLQCEVSIDVGYGKEEWGAEKDKTYYVLSIQKVKELR